MELRHSLRTKYLPSVKLYDSAWLYPFAMINNPFKRNIHEISHISNSDISRDTFHAAMWPGNYTKIQILPKRFWEIYNFLVVLTVAQFFGLMPLHKIRNLHSLSFRWLSLRVLISAVYLVIGAFMTYFYMNRLTKVGITAKNLGTK